MNDMKNILMQLNNLKQDLRKDGMRQESRVVDNAMNFIETHMSYVDNRGVTKEDKLDTL